MVISGGGRKWSLTKGKDMKQETNDQNASLKPCETEEFFSSTNSGLFHNVTTPHIHKPP